MLGKAGITIDQNQPVYRQASHILSNLMHRPSRLQSAYRGSVLTHCKRKSPPAWTDYYLNLMGKTVAGDVTP